MRVVLISVLIIIIGITVPNAICRDSFGPYVLETKGAIWPKPQLHDNFQGFYVLQPQAFRFQVVDKSCGLLKDALSRYLTIVTDTSNYPPFHSEEQIYDDDPDFKGYIEVLNVSLTGLCTDQDYPSGSMVENYTLTLKNDKFVLDAVSIWGVLRGLESFSQLVHLYNDEQTLVLNQTYIEDFPKYSYRSLLVDTARHFIPVEAIYQTLDAMSYNKLNVFHWHVTDDESFPFVSEKFPELSEGAFHSGLFTYSVQDMKDVVEYARTHGIRVVPEFNTPGHTKSWGRGMETLLCIDTSTSEGYGPINPASPKTYEVLETLYEEIFSIFPEELVHIGGNDIDTTCWMNDPEIQAFMVSMNITGNYEALTQYYMEKLFGIFERYGRTALVREEIWNQNGELELPKNVIVDIWRGIYPIYIDSFTNNGKPVILSGSWMMEDLQIKGAWFVLYLVRPRSNLSEEQKKLVLGGEAVLYTQNINSFNILTRSWPKAGSVAERLWTDEEWNDDSLYDVTMRFEEHMCRLIRRNIPASPEIGPGFCI